MLRDTPLIILDEATAYADAENEAKIQDAFAQLAARKTVLVIAHRMKTVRTADLIVVVGRGVRGRHGHARRPHGRLPVVHPLDGGRGRAQGRADADRRKGRRTTWDA